MIRFQYAQCFLASTRIRNEGGKGKLRTKFTRPEDLPMRTEILGLVATTLNNITRDLPVNRYAKLFSVTVVKGATGEILDS